MTDFAIYRFLLSLLLQSRDACNISKGKLAPEDLPDPFHSSILGALFSFPETTPWSLKILAETMGISQSSEEYTALTDLYTEAFRGEFDFRSSGNIEIVEDTIVHVVNRSKKRFAQIACTEIARRCEEAVVDMQIIEADLVELQNKLCSGTGRKTWSDRTKDWLDKFQERYEQGKERSPLGTGLPKIDELIQRFTPGELVVVAAKRKVGKSAFMVGIVNKFSIEQKIPGLIITLEMGSTEWYDRIFAYRCNIDSQIISNPSPSTVSTFHFNKLASNLEIVQTAPMNIEDSDCFTIAQIESLIRYYRIKSDIQYAIVDHAQLIQSPGSKNQNRTDELDKIGVRLKNLSKKLAITIFLLSQTNDRGVTFGASMLEAHLNKLIRLEIPEGEPEHTQRRYINLLLNRSGKTGGVEAIFDGATCRFTEVTRMNEEEAPRKHWNEQYA